MPNTYELAQFHFTDDAPIHKWIDQISIKKSDTIIEIGPGKGEITNFLLKLAQEVKIIEYDETRKKELNKLAQENDNIKVFFSDFTKFQIFDDKYKVISNIPFNLTRKIFENLLFQKHMAASIYFLLQKEVVAKICQRKRSNLLSVFLQTFYTTKPRMNFRRNFFNPSANVDVQSIEMHLKEIKSTRSERKRYLKMLNIVFETTNKPLINKFKKIISHKQSKILFKEFKLSDDIAPQQITHDTWWEIFKHIQPFIKD